MSDICPAAGIEALTLYIRRIDDSLARIADGLERLVALADERASREQEVEDCACDRPDA